MGQVGHLTEKRRTEGRSMPELDLTDFGFAGKKYVFEGDVVEVKTDGERLLFLFAEKHKQLASIGPNIRNCIRLTDDGVVGYVGLEYNPEDHQLAKYSRTGNLNADVEAIIQSDMDAVGEPRFGTSVRRLTNVPVEVVEDMDIWKVAEQIEYEIKERVISAKQVELFAKLKAENPQKKAITLDQQARNEAEADPEISKQFRAEFGEDPINRKRDEAMISTLLSRWTDAGIEKAAVLNAGKKHIDRIKHMLPPYVRYIYVCQPV